MTLSIKNSTNDDQKHDLDITSLVFHNNKLLSGADDGKIKLWDANLKLLCEVQAHPCSIFSLAVGNDTVYSCSNDGSVKVWSLDGLKEKGTILQEENEMWKQCFNGEKLYVGDDAGLVRIFEYNTMVGVLEIMHPITDLLAMNNVVYTARDLYVLISEVFPGTKKISTLQALEGRAPVCVIGDQLCFCSRSGKDINIHENSKSSSFKNVGQIKDAHDLIINALCGVSKSDNENFLCTGGWDKMLKRWKIGNNVSARIVESCPVDMCITTLTAGNEGQMYVGGGDGRILRVDDI